jgi:hypothetical protein
MSGDRYGPVMSTTATAFQMLVIRQIFPSWAIAVPYGFEETLETDGGYWHAWDEHRSVSLSSVRCFDGERPVTAREMLGRFTRTCTVPGATGATIDPPRGLAGWGVEMDAPPDSRASRVLTGVIAVDGCAAVLTITSDDPYWSRTIWDSLTPMGDPSAARSLVPPGTLADLEPRDGSRASRRERRLEPRRHGRRT